MTTIMITTLIFTLIIALFYFISRMITAEDQIKDVQERLISVNSANPWKSQLMLMLKSQQSVVSHPQITKGSMLYGALILEEVAETIMALAQGIEEASAGVGSDFYKIAVGYSKISVTMKNASTAARDAIKATNETPTRLLLSQQIAKDILDGITDVHVVTSGLGIACGLPGQAAFDMVTSSNLSKANPVTGLIDKDPSGKWIKGPNYKEPNLDVLLAPYYFGR
jgi:predicted HAD superfamily Cof-like phosphohydrolase